MEISGMWTRHQMSHCLRILFLGKFRETGMAVTHSERKLRPRIQRAFMAWLDANRSSFAVPVQLGRRTGKHWKIRFGGITPYVSAVLIGNGTQSELVVAAEWQGECWDLFASFETLPCRYGALYFCALCEKSQHQVFGSRQELWFDHLFAPFLDWVNQKLAPANWLVLDDHGGATSAALSVERPDDEANRIILSLSEKETHLDPKNK